MLRAIRGLIAGRPSGEASGRRWEAAALLDGYSFEVTGAKRAVAEACAAPVAKGTEVFIAFVPGESHDRSVTAAKELRDAGLAPVPHIVARSFESVSELDRLLGRLGQDSGARSALVLAGDRPQPAGPFHCSEQLIETGLFERHGFTSVSFACHPEPHPQVPEAVMRDALKAKIAAARARGLAPRLVSQFSLEAGPILRRLDELADEAPDVPIRVGIAGPASHKTLIKYAIYCGVGNALTAMANQGEKMSQLAAQENQDALLGDIAAALAEKSMRHPPVEGIHIFTFGGTAKSIAWANDFAAEAK
jgi:methylenetetrahydrofolate reductase (NADPH)